MIRQFYQRLPFRRMAGFGAPPPANPPRAWWWIGDVEWVLLRMAPGAVLLYTAIFILSQVTLLIALLLPWSILASLSFGQVSVRLRWIFEGYGPSTVVPVLMVLIVVFFAVHLIAEAGNARLVRQTARQIIERHDKTGFSDALRSQAVPYLGRLLGFFATLLWSLLAAGLMAFFYPALLAVLIAYAVLGALAVKLLQPDKRWGPAISAELRGKAWWGVGFIILVGYVIFHAYHEILPRYWAVFAGLLLGRQILVNLVSLRANVNNLLKHAERVEALFLPDTPLAPPSRESDGFAGIAQRDARAAWLPPLLTAYRAEDCEVREDATQWEQGGKVLCLLLETTGQQDRALMIRVFHKSIVELGRHERNILIHAQPGWPAPEFLGESELPEGHLALVFAWAKGRGWLPRQAIVRPAMLVLRKNLFSCEIPEGLADRYKRGNIQLGQHLARIDWAHLQQLAPTPDVAASCSRLHDVWPALLRWLGQQPLQVVLDALASRRMTRGADGALMVCNWTRWRLEPLGMDWPFEERPRKELEQVLAEAALNRPALLAVTADDVCLVAHLEKFRRLDAAGNYEALFNMADSLEAQWRSRLEGVR
ncbi:MAG: hypothetical protein LBE78_12035 [Burkholderiaceae bacterium]|jgi:hypothetical protein|nr:hypothetical protein [Burkholderiaceae bacterium]